MSFKTLVSTEELNKHLDDPDWVIFDCRFTLTDPGAGKAAYDQNHIPGARYAHLDDDLAAPIGPDTGRHPLPDPEIFAGKLGVMLDAMSARLAFASSTSRATVLPHRRSGLEKNSFDQTGKQS